MSCIIKMSSDELLDKFIKKFDYKKFNFLLISENIKTEKRYKNVYAIPSLIPPPNIISTFINEGNSKNYVKKYLDYISTPRVEAMITIAVKLAIIDNSNVVLLCSKDEDEFGYVDIICQYIENIYGVQTYSYKKYKKNPEKCENVDDKVKKRVSKILEKKIGEMKDIEDSPKLKKKDMLTKIEKLSKKELKKILKSNSIDYDKDDSKKKLIKKVMKNLM